MDEAYADQFGYEGLRSVAGEFEIVFVEYFDAGKSFELHQCRALSVVFGFQLFCQQMLNEVTIAFVLFNVGLRQGGPSF